MFWKVVAAMVLLMGTAAAVSAHGGSTGNGQEVWPFTPARTLSLEVIGENPGGLRLVQAPRLFRSASTPETRGELPTAESSRRIYVVSNPAFDVVDAVCHPGHGEVSIQPVVRTAVGGGHVVVDGIAVSGSSAVCHAIALKVR